MTLLSGMDPFRIFEFAVLLANLLALPWLLVSRPAGRKQRNDPSAVQAATADALAVYLCGNSDLTRLRALAAARPDEVREAILRYQSMVAGQREEFCQLAFALGYVQTWWYDAQSSDVAQRRQAFARISAMAHHEPVRRMAGDIAANAFSDSDEQVRLSAARILLAGGDRQAITRVYEASISGPEVRSVLSVELARHAALLCEDAIPWALRSGNPLEVLRMLLSWQRALPLPSLGSLPTHQDAEVRLEAMRLLPYLPPTAENQQATLLGLADSDPAVSQAAAAAIRLGLPKQDPAAHANDGALRMVHAEMKDLAGRLVVSAGPFLRVPSIAGAVFGPIANPFANWRMIDAQN